MEVVALSSKMKTTSSLRISAIQVCPLISEQHIDDSWMTTPTSYLEGKPVFVLSFDVGVALFLEHKVVQHLFVAIPAAHVNGREFVSANQVQVNFNILRHRRVLVLCTINLIVRLT